VFDRPGFGYSERPRTRLWTAQAQAHLLDEALDRLQVGRALVYGHSLGAQVAVELALLCPERVGALVLASGYYYPTVRLDVPLFAPPAIPVIGDVMRYTISPILAERLLPRIYRKLFAPAPVPGRFWRNFPHGLVLRPSHLRATSEDTAFLIPNAMRSQDRYGELAMPVTIVTGDGDEVVFMHKHAQRLHDEVPHSRLVVVPGAGHMIHHTALDEVTGVIEALLPRSPSRPRPAPHRAGAGAERAAPLHQAR
jgi:pimeloyl-ACP methyl ester carboxylesterase